MVEFFNRRLVKIAFSIHYKTEFGQSIAIVGETSQLGLWKDFKKMTWHNGDVWRITLTVDRDEPFQYKYVVVDKDRNAVRWEEGLNRICDPEYLEPVSEISSVSTFDEDSDSKLLSLEEEWNHFTVTFCIYFPGL
jgi:Starch binding domain